MVNGSGIGKWFWAACIIVTFLNGAVFHFRAKKRIQENPDLEKGYQKIIKGFVTWGNLPWIVMGIGCTVGGIPSVFSYFHPQDGNPYVLAFFASVFLVWILGSYWILFRGGAQELVTHPGMFNYEITSPTIIKLVWIACLVGGIVAAVLMFTQNIPVPNVSL